MDFHFQVLFLLCSASQFAAAWFRVPCTTPLVSERVDPIGYPGIIPSNHVHTVHGAQTFAANATYESLLESNCTSCQVTEDRSLYWFPTLYYHDRENVTFEIVPNGRLLVYYLYRGELAPINGGPGLKAYPPGFRMVTGSATLRSRKFSVGNANQNELRQRAIEWMCIGGSPLGGDYSNFETGAGFPHSNCPGGFNARLQFPNCWNGIDLDAPDHRSHVAYLDRLDNGICPEQYPIGLVTLLYEVTWDVDSFAHRWNPDVDAWPFVYSTGDPTGYSWHGDFLSGWPDDVMANALSNCDSPSNQEQYAGITEACPYLTVVDGEVAESCKLEPIIHEPIHGPLKRLPGCNPLQSGPEDAIIYSDLDCPE